jgi:hypothetical protein
VAERKDEPWAVSRIGDVVLMDQHQLLAHNPDPLDVDLQVPTDRELAPELPSQGELITVRPCCFNLRRQSDPDPFFATLLPALLHILRSVIQLGSDYDMITGL